MLKYLHIENIAVIERSNIEFTDGFNVLTGETGAGKSILIDAINAVLGERTSKDLIRAGCDTAEVSAVFGNFTQDCLDDLLNQDISPDEDGNILIWRRLSIKGNGIIKINGKPLTASVLREIAPLLINIHGQHDNQALLNPEKHCAFLDAIAEDDLQISEYYSEFKRLNEIRRSLANLETDEDEKQRRVDLLNYQIDELEKADIKIGELEQLKKQLKFAENRENNLKVLNSALALLQGNDEADGALTQISNAAKQLSAFKGDEFDAFYSQLNDIFSQVSDISAEIASFIDNSEFSEINSDNINLRLDLLQKLMLKYGNSEEKMLEFLSSAKAELDEISFSDKRILQLSDELDKSKLRLIDLAEVLSLKRKAVAEHFEKEVTETLRYLNMPSVTFKVKIEQGRYTKLGCDDVEFMICTNEGEDLKPLHKIASGGELSRTMLAIKSCMLGKDTVGSMIFDEIDTGISGYAADKVGNQLKKVSKKRQVICVTHLAQIAARADTHLRIEKAVSNGRTFTSVTPLEYTDRINEIARIMSGTEITENLYNSAKELIDRSI